MWRRLVMMIILVTALAAAGYRSLFRQLPRLEPATHPHPVGTYHVHSSASHDGRVKLNTIARMAEELQLDFVIVTDHNTQLAGPVNIDGVWILSYSELSTPFGHVVQLGANKLLDARERRGLDILDRIDALGGFPIAAHPADPKRPWTGPVEGLGGFEIASFSSSTRRRGGPIFVGLFPALAVYQLNRNLALAQVLDRDATTLRRWDAERDPRIVGLCAPDAHGRILDMYEELRTWHIVLEAPLPSDSEQVCAALLDAIRKGRFHCVSGLFARDPEFDFAAEWLGERVAESGSTVPTSGLDALVTVGPRSTIDTPTLVLLRNGQEVARTQGGRLRYSNPIPGTYRVEVRLPIPGVLWGYRVVPVIYSNRIRVTGAPDELSTDALPSDEPKLGNRSPNASEGNDSSELKRGGQPAARLSPVPSQPPAESQPEPPAESRPEPPAESRPEPPAESQPEPPVESQPEPPAESQPEPPVESRPEPPAESRPEPPAESRPEPPAESRPEPPAESQPEPPAELLSEPPAESQSIAPSSGPADQTEPRSTP